MVVLHVLPSRFDTFKARFTPHRSKMFDLSGFLIELRDVPGLLLNKLPLTVKIRSVDSGITCNSNEII